MEKNEVLKQVNEIFIDVLNNQNLVLNYETNANDVEEWDSLMHVQLVVAIERHFKIRFTSQEFRSWNNIGNMIDSILNKISKN